MEKTLELILTELQELKSGQQKFESRMTQFEVNVQKRFTQSEKRMEERIDKRFAESEDRLQASGNRLDNQIRLQGTKFNSRLNFFEAAIDSRLHTVEKGQTRLETKLDNLGSELRSNFKHLDKELKHHKEIFEVVSHKLQ